MNKKLRLKALRKKLKVAEQKAEASKTNLQTAQDRLFFSDAKVKAIKEKIAEIEASDE